MRGMAGPLVKLVVFALVTILAAYVLISTITNAGYGEQTVYRAQFTDVAGLVEGDEVRIAGVRVGQVVSIGLVPGQTDRPVAEVALEVDADVPLPSGVQATIRYRNLVGQRYIALAEGDGGETLDENAVIPLAQTKPALDLTVLFGGFQPLLTALDPEDMNRLSFEIIQVFQGEGGTVESLLSHVASLTSSLADKDAVIGDMIDNLTTVLSSVAQRDQLAPTKIDLITRTAINGSWFNFFMCSSNATVTLPATGLPGNEQETGVLSPTIESGAEGCS